MKFDILTIFPELFYPFISTSLIKAGIEKKILEINVINFRDFSSDKHKKVDDRPYGGGPGMVLMAQPIADAIDSLKIDRKEEELIFLTPQGKVFNQDIACQLSKKRRLVLVCGRYEGFDERLIEIYKPFEISIGDYVLMGGELPAMVIIEAVARLIPGVLGEEDSCKEESFVEGLLEYPQYTRPPIFRGLKVPEVLLSGNHKRIQEWRKEAAIKNTLKKRPDLLERYKYKNVD